SGSSILKPPRLVDGHDVMKNLKIGPGRAVGNVLERIRELQEEGSISSRAEALREVRKGVRRTAGE
ncbi:MAG: CCA tRNA nucleotidyltransferase, partial [Acidobacteria bacterium]|nr:CCA tRNA nucleotidyltransferase [Acidobacteriota bacterium]